METEVEVICGAYGIQVVVEIPKTSRLRRLIVGKTTLHIPVDDGEGRIVVKDFEVPGNARIDSFNVLTGGQMKTDDLT